LIHVVADNDVYLQNLNNQSRDKTLKNNVLAKIHTLLGEALGRAMLNFRPLENNYIESVQDITCAVQEVSKKNITIVVLMRAGLYLGQGVRNILDNDDQCFLLSNNVEDIDLAYIDGRDVIIVDSVINSGKTMVQYIHSLHTAKSITCISIVMQEKFKLIAGQLPHILFLTSRISENSYVGKGTTDTGNRLFGTIKESI
jgi:uracil phosphoribosyltransferase